MRPTFPDEFRLALLEFAGLLQGGGGVGGAPALHAGEGGVVSDRLQLALRQRRPQEGVETPELTQDVLLHVLVEEEQDVGVVSPRPALCQVRPVGGLEDCSGGSLSKTMKWFWCKEYIFLFLEDALKYQRYEAYRHDAGKC